MSFSRKDFHLYLNSLRVYNGANDPQTNREIVFLHCDAWKYNGYYKTISVGVQEPNMLNIAAGLMLAGKTVIVYSQAGFVLEKCMEQFRLVLPDTGRLIILNSGNHGEYPANLGKGHNFSINLLREYYKVLGFRIFDLHDNSKVKPEDVFRFRANVNKHLVLLGKE